MRISKLVLPLALVCLFAAACSSDNDDSAPTSLTVEAAATSLTGDTAETPSEEPAEGADPESSPTSEPAIQASESVDGAVPRSSPGSTPITAELIDTFARLALADEFAVKYLTAEEITCMAEQSFGLFSEQRLVELGITSDSITEAYERPGLFVIGDVFDITEQEAFELENRAMGCLDWRSLVIDALVLEGIAPEQAECITSEISVEVLRAVVSDSFVIDSGEGFGAAQGEVLKAFAACQAG